MLFTYFKLCVIAAIASAAALPNACTPDQISNGNQKIEVAGTPTGYFTSTDQQASFKVPAGTRITAIKKVYVKRFATGEIFEVSQLDAMPPTLVNTWDTQAHIFYKVPETLVTAKYKYVALVEIDGQHLCTVDTDPTFGIAQKTW